MRVRVPCAGPLAATHSVVAAEGECLVHWECQDSVRPSHHQGQSGLLPRGGQRFVDFAEMELQERQLMELVGHTRVNLAR